jgi:ribose/xylose/arabinose/galactoside ABC-type transport system permease subunit
MKSPFISAELRQGLQSAVGLLVIGLVFAVLAPTFRQWPAIRSVLEQSTVLAIMAAGSTIVLISGGLDLSIGSVLALSTCVVGSLLIVDVPVPIAVLAGIGVGAAVGTINGLIIVGTGIPSLVATLGMMMIARGVALMVGAGKDMSRFPESFQWLGAGFVGPVLIMMIVFLSMGVLLSKTKLGFDAYAIGGNEEVARLAGVPVNRIRIIYYAIGGALAGLASVVETARLNFATPNRGEGMELQAIAAVVIGGTSMFGGMGGVGRTIIGVLIIKTLEAGLIHLRVGSFWQRVAIGVVIILAVWLDRVQRTRAAAAATVSDV